MRLLQVVLALAVLATLLWLPYWIGKSFLLYLNAIPKELAATLITAATTVLGATLTIAIGRYFERKKELDALYRDKKTEIYDEFLRKYFDLNFSNSDHSPTTQPQDLVSYFREFIRRMLLWSGPQVIVAFLKWKRHITNNAPDAKTIFLTEDFFLALRADLRQSNSGIPKGFWSHLSLKRSDLFLAAAKKDPHVTLAQLAEIEKHLSDSSGDE
ncbi:hypothetical protein [Dokdonella sp.]|uniref:hypothetical protein n=1 Tax=Dokdonella sp. TaxID=2291710 RepID=UPI00378359FD